MTWRWPVGHVVQLAGEEGDELLTTSPHTPAWYQNMYLTLLIYVILRQDEEKQDYDY